MGINKIVYNGGTLIDLTGDTVTADKLMQGYTAHDKSGEVIIGTATGGGGTIGLEYEEGTWSPSEDVARQTISFSNTHDSLPMFAAIYDVTGTYDGTINSNYAMMFSLCEPMFGSVMNPSTKSQYIGFASFLYRLNATSFAGSYIGLATSQKWIDETGFLAYCQSSSRYWRAGRTYKWIAVWKPTT